VIVLELPTTQAVTRRACYRRTTAAARPGRRDPLRISIIDLEEFFFLCCWPEEPCAGSGGAAPFLVLTEDQPSPGTLSLISEAGGIAVTESERDLLPVILARLGGKARLLRPDEAVRRHCPAALRRRKDRMRRNGGGRLSLKEGGS
jgi:hypothetical protein